ncbi:hypothetical protein EBU71_00260 [bacterium]|jgi:hypothetical protein|nr:hypothetical protein [Candidatus Elulimicrobium humile]
MPIYSFENTKTGETFEQEMKYEELEKYLKKNKNIIQIFTKFPGTIAPWNATGNTGAAKGRKKDFKEVLNKIHKKTPGSVLNKTTDL